jgi:hypothetical protein
LFRPEFLKRFEYLWKFPTDIFGYRSPKPLSSDALSKFGHLDSQIHDLEIQKATQYLETKLTNSLAR